MTLVKLKPTTQNLYDEMNNMIKTVFNHDWTLNHKSEIDYSLQVDINETDKSFIINADIPGLTKKDVKVEIIDKTLVISGERKSESDQNNDIYHYSERPFGVFKRSFKLPKSVNEEKISATFKNGILKIELQKQKDTLPITREIKVN